MPKDNFYYTWRIEQVQRFTFFFISIFVSQSFSLLKVSSSNFFQLFQVSYISIKLRKNKK